MLLMIDNYDSFTYNLVQYLMELGEEVKVVRNDELTPDDVARMKPGRIVISPGPCTPNEAGISVAVIRRFAGSIPILGVCLGHQAIGQAFGGQIVRAKRVMHGKTSMIHHDGKTIYQGLSNPFEATRYHSLVIEESSLPECLEITARTDDGEIMGVRHRQCQRHRQRRQHRSPSVEGVQFHPESILTVEGKRLLGNFLRLKVTTQVNRK